jgi:hypothetical protein
LFSRRPSRDLSWSAQDRRPVVNNDSGNQASVAIHRTRSQFDVFGKCKLSLITPLARWLDAWPFSDASRKATRTRIRCLATVYTLRVAVPNCNAASIQIDSCAKGPASAWAGPWSDQDDSFRRSREPRLNPVASTRRAVRACGLAKYVHSSSTLLELSDSAGWIKE